MKQVIVLLCSIVLGVFIVNLIIGDKGIGTTAQNVWRSEYTFRSSAFQRSDE